MNRLATSLSVFVGCLVGSAASGADATSPLDLVPKDAAGFVHVRVGDVWKHEAFAPVRDYLTRTEPTLLKEFEGQFGFVPADVETLTLIYPSFSKQSLSPPLVVVQTGKPYDKARVVMALRGLSAAQYHDLEYQHLHEHRFAPATAPADFPKGAPAPLPRQDVPPAIEKDFKRQEAPEEDDPNNNPYEPRLPKPDLRARHFILNSGAGHLYCLDERTLVFAPAFRHEGNALGIMPYIVQMLRRQEKGVLNPALAEAAKRTAVVAIDSEAFARTLPGKLGSGDEALLRPMTIAKLAMLSLDLGKDLNATLSFQAANVADARKIEDAMHGSIGALKKGIPEWRKEAKRSTVPDLAALLVDQLERAADTLAVKQNGTTVTATTAIKADDAFLTALKAGVAQVKVARERVISQNNLKQLGMAIHNYHAANNRLPFPGVAKFGAPLGPGNNNPNLSWRVAILPYIEQQALYQQFKLDEPWDSEHNKKLIDKMPKLFAPVNGVKAEKGHTFYQIFSGREALKPGVRFTDVTDGLSNTLMIVEAGDSVPWTRPEDMLYDAKKPLPKLGAMFSGDFNAAFMDGSVRYIRKSINENTLRAIITIAGGENVGDWNN